MKHFFTEYWGVGLFILIVAACYALFIFRMMDSQFWYTSPFSRECKKCGAVQNMFSSNIEGEEDRFWWEEVVPGKRDVPCNCKKYTFRE